MQRLVPELTASGLWTEPPLPVAGAWHADADAAALVAAVTPREVAVEEAEAKLAAFADTLPAGQRGGRLALLFSGLVEATNAERADLIARIRGLARRQQELAEMIRAITAEWRALPDEADEDPTSAEGEKRTELTDRRALLVRQFEDTQRTMRFACDAPTQLEARLGRYARVLQAMLP
jgi:hypothetical protein